MTAQLVASDRAASHCQACGQVDDHPRHVMYVAADNPVTGEPADLTVSRHIDCCAAAGCDVCVTHLEFTGRKRGPELVDHMVNLPAGHAQALWDRHGIATRPAPNEEPTAGGEAG